MLERRSTIISSYILLFVFLVACNVYAGTREQKKAANSVISGYGELFKYYNQRQSEFITHNEETDTNIFLDELAMLDLQRLFNNAMNSDIKNLPLYLSDESRSYISSLDSRIDEIFPDSQGESLLKEMNNKASSWKYLITPSGGQLLLTALLTGPKLGLDIVSGGASKIGSYIVKGGEYSRKITRIGRNFLEIKSVSCKRLKDISIFFSRIDFSLMKRFYFTTETKKYLDLLDNKGFELFKIILERAIIYYQTSEELQLTLDQKDTIINFINENKNDLDKEDNILLQFYIKLSANSFKFGNEIVESANKAAIGIFIDIFQTGILSAASSDSNLLETLKNVIIECTMKGLEFVPIAGPFMETINANLDAAKDIENLFLLAQSNYMTFYNSKNNEADLQLNIFKLMVLEDTLKEIFLNDNPVYDNYSNTWDVNIFGMIDSINNIAEAIGEIDFDKTIAKSISKYELNCYVKYRDKSNEIAESDLIYKNQDNSHYVTSTCDNLNNYFSVSVHNENYKDKDVELYFTLKDRKLFKIPQGFQLYDVGKEKFCYKDVKYLAYKGAIDGSKPKFNPDGNISQYEFLKMATLLFCKENFERYKDNIYCHSNDEKECEQKRYFYFFNEKIIESDIDKLLFDNKDIDITRGQVAELLFSLIFRETGFYCSDPSSPSKICIKKPTSEKKYSYLFSNKKKYISTIDNDWDKYSGLLRALEISNGDIYGKYNKNNLILRGEVAKLLCRSKIFLDQYHQ